MSNDFGIKVSQIGQDVTDGDTQQVFSSSWPVLRIITAKELRDLSHSATTIPHNLKFTPAFITYGPTSDSNLNMPRQNIYADSSNLYWSHPGVGSILDDTYIIVLDVDIETAFKAPQINASTSSQAVSVSDFGIRLTKPTKDVSSKDLRDYIIHSSARSPMLHAVVPGVTDSNGSFSYTHDLPYNPIFFVYAQALTASFGNPYVLLNNFAGVTTSGSTISITGALSNTKVSVVILKDPFTINSNIIKVIV